MTTQNQTHELYNVAEVELTYRKNQNVFQPKVTSSEAASKIILASWDMNRIDLVEEFKILLTDRKGACIGISNISIGGTTGCIADPKIIFTTALKANAAGIILVHNHPSGNLLPSSQDLNLTRKLVDGGKILDLPVLDHLIVTSTGYTSFIQQGLMPD